MRKTAIGLAAMMAAGVSAGCSLLGPAVPKCSDPETLDLVRQIIAEDVGAVGNRTLTNETLRSYLSIELPHAISLEENIKKYTCGATLGIKDEKGKKHNVNITYTTQLDDSDQHLAHTTGLTGLDRLALIENLERALRDAGRSSTQVSSATSPGDADLAAGQAAEAAMAADAAQTYAFPEPVENTPEQVAENNRVRAMALNGEGENGNPKFTDYMVDEVFAGPSAPLDMRSETAKTFKTRLSEALSDGTIDFAGDYISATWGCGTSCATTTFISKRNGQVADGIGGEGGPRVVKHLQNSRLLIAEGPEVDDDYNQTGNFAFYYEMKDGELQLIKKVPIPIEIY